MLGISEEVFLFDHLGGYECRRAGHRIASVAAGSGDGFEAFLVFVSHGHACHREAISKSFADGNDIRHNAPMLHAEPLSCSAPACEDLVDHHQKASVIAELAQLGEEIIWRNHRSTPALDWLEDETGDIAHGGLVQILVVEGKVGIGVDAAIGF